MTSTLRKNHEGGAECPLGLIRPSFIPPPAIQALRDLTRTRVALVQTRSQAKNSVIKVLEDTNIKLSSVVANVFGASGRRMLAALSAGKREPKVLAALARWRLRRKLSKLEVALTGLFTSYHARLIQGVLELIDLLDRQIADLNKRIGDLVAPLAPQMEQLTSLPGGETTAARVMLVKIGTDMSRFRADTRLASWAGMCPGNDESAGKRRRGRTRKGNRYLRWVLVQCAWGARKTPTYLSAPISQLIVGLSAHF